MYPVECVKTFTVCFFCLTAEEYRHHCSKNQSSLASDKCNLWWWSL